MITCNLTGNLANQLFQIFTTICYARENNDTFYFVLSNFLSDGNITYWDSLFQRISLYNMLPHRMDLATIVIKEQIPHQFMPIPRLNNIVKRSNVIVKIVGNYNNYKYFGAQKDAIFNLIDFKGQATRQCFGNKYQIGVWDDISLNQSFLAKCLQQFDNSSNILYFSESTTDDVALKLLQFSQCCTHHIISTTSIAFWSAYLNSSPEKQVYYDGDQIQQMNYPPDWKGLSIK